MGEQFRTRFWSEKPSQQALHTADAEMIAMGYSLYGGAEIVPVSGPIGYVRVYRRHSPTLLEAREAFVAFVNHLNLLKVDRLEANRLIAAWREAIVKGGPYE